MLIFGCSAWNPDTQENVWCGPLYMVKVSYRWNTTEHFVKSDDREMLWMETPEGVMERDAPRLPSFTQEQSRSEDDLTSPNKHLSCT